MGRFPGQLLRRTELIKRSLRQDDEPTWWCLELLHKWYGQGGGWTDRGVPMYVAIDRKPENGCEIQHTACGRSGIMLYLQLVSTAGDQRQRLAPAESRLLHELSS